MEDQYDEQAAELVGSVNSIDDHDTGVLVPLIAAALRAAAQAERERCVSAVNWFIEAADRGQRISPDADTRRVIGYHREAYEMVRDRLLDTGGTLE